MDKTSLSKSVIYDKQGKPRLFFSNKNDLITFRGTFVGFLKGDALYDYNGVQRGWFENGAMRDMRGNFVGFTTDMSDDFHPLLPLKKLLPISPMVPLAPLRPLTQLKKLKPLKTLYWSQKDPVSLFEVGKA